MGGAVGGRVVGVWPGRCFIRGPGVDGAVLSGAAPKEIMLIFGRETLPLLAVG